MLGFVESQWEIASYAKAHLDTSIFVAAIPKMLGNGKVNRKVSITNTVVYVVNLKDVLWLKRERLSDLQHVSSWLRCNF